MRKFSVLGCPVENQATPVGGFGGAVQLPVLTPATIAVGVKTVLPKTRLLAVVPQGLVPPGPAPPPPPRPPHHWTCSPTMMVLELPSDMAVLRAGRRIGERREDAAAAGT